MDILQGFWNIVKGFFLNSSSTTNEVNETPGNEVRATNEVNETPQNEVRATNKSDVVVPDITDEIAHSHKGYIKYGKYMIGSMCHQTLPCQHYVINIETGNKALLFGDVILGLLDDINMTAPHFEEYRDRLNKSRSR